MVGQRGFSYVIVLFTVAIASVVALRALTVTATVERRLREADLLAVGQAYRAAIRDYYENTPGTVRRLPPTLAELLDDTRTNVRHRHLRKEFRDPMTGGAWVLLRDADDRLIGVRSGSPAVPLKRGAFPAGLEHFAAAHSYQDWTFVFNPNASTQKELSP